MSLLHLRIYGIPAPKGSKRFFRNAKTGKAIGVESNAPALGEWMQKIAAEAIMCIREAGIRPPEPPYFVMLHFFLPRPKSAKKGVRYHQKRPDLDKLARAVLDALTGPIWSDDAQVSSLNLTKRYADALCVPGVYITVKTDGEG